jgi:phage terminase small subunit
MGDKLTPKQEAFALKYVECSNASEAYRHAYNVRPDTTPEAIWVNGCKSLAHAKVSQRVYELQQLAQERTLVTIESITRELEEARLLGKTTEQSSAMTAASMGKAKVNGLLVEKVDARHTGKIDTKWTIEVVRPDK